MTDIKMTINGQLVSAKQGETIIQVADRHGIYIPRFCYHKELSIAANCRMCLVEVEKAPKPLPACATQVMPDMAVATKSALTQKAQKAIMSFLLINHPLECPICDQGGECDLQDLAADYGSSEGYAPVDKRSVADEDLGPLVQTHMTRCIQCTRCVRFGREIAGYPELGQLGRGNGVSIGTWLKNGISSEVSGNIIELCPVGALTDKTSRFQGRSWGYQRHPSIAPHDCIGSHIYVHTNQTALKNNQLMRIVPRHANGLNHIWLADRDRFSYSGLNHERCSTPMMKKRGMWQEASWQEVLLCLTDKFHDMQKQQKRIAWLSGPQSTTEEAFMLQYLARGLGFHDIDSRIRLGDDRDQSCYDGPPGAFGSLDNLREYDHIMIVGGHIAQDQPVMNLQIRQASLHGTQVSTCRSTNQPMHMSLTKDFIAHPALWEQFLSDWFKARTKDKKYLVICANDIFYHQQGSELRQHIYHGAAQCNADVWQCTDGPNTQGQWLAGMLPHLGPSGQQLKRQGRGFHDLLKDGADCFWLHGIEPTKDVLQSKRFCQRLDEAELVVCVHPYMDPSCEEFADIILPSTPFTETPGTFVNVFGMHQSFQPVVKPWGQSKPALDIYKALAECCELPSCDLDHELSKLKTLSKLGVYHHNDCLINDASTFAKIDRWPMASVNACTRRSRALQQAFPVTDMPHIVWHAQGEK